MAENLYLYNKNNNLMYCSGAQERTRTSTSIRTLAPEASASTNSATWAGVVGTAFKLGMAQSQRSDASK